MGTKEIPSQESNSVEQNFTFAKVVESMLPRGADGRLVRSIARHCCKRGGYPGGCTCHEEVVHSTAWLSWPKKVLDFLATLVSRFHRRLVSRARKIAIA